MIRRTLRVVALLAFVPFGLAGAQVAASPSPEQGLAAARRELARASEAGDAEAVRAATGRIALQFIRNGPADSAEAWNLRLIALSRMARDSMTMAVSMMWQGRAYGARLVGDSARTMLREAAAVLHLIGRDDLSLSALADIASVFDAEGQVDSAIVTSRAVLAGWRRLGNRTEIVRASVLLAARMVAISRFDSALAVTVATLADLSSRSDASEMGALFEVRGAAFAGSGRYDSALVNFKRSLGHWGQTGDDTMRASPLGSIGMIYRWMGQFDSAVVYHRRQREVGERLKSLEQQVAAVALLAQAFEAAGASDSALATYRVQQRLAARAGNAAREIAAWERICSLLGRRGDTASAHVALLEALARSRSAPGMRQTAAGLVDLALLFRRAGATDSALATHRAARALAAARGDRLVEEAALNAMAALEAELGHATTGLALLRQALTISRASGALAESATNLAGIGYLLRRLPTPDLAAAVASFDTAATYRAMVRQQAGDDANRVSVGTVVTRYAGEWELTWLARATSLGAEAAALAALAATERGRAQALLDLMRGTISARTDGADPLAEGRRLVGAATRAGAAMLSYLVTADTLVTWYARPGAPLVARTVAVRADSLATLVARWRGALRAGGGAARFASRGIETDDALVGGNAEALGAALARLLLPTDLQTPGGPRELVIVPHAALTLLPFAPLPLGGAGGTLASRFAVRYAPSLASLGAAEDGIAPMSRNARRSALRAALVVGNPAMPSVRTASGEPVSLDPLPAAEREAQAVATRVGTTLLTGRAAGESEIRRRMTNAPLIHLATHGYAYATAGQARNSFVALAADSASDGLLTVGEVLGGAQLRADLVVLSACQTGLGNLAEAEGTVGLQRAFLARGARSLLVSLWSVSDEATALLMDRFYAHWLTDADAPGKSEALRRAQADVRGTKGFEEPRYWAAFQLVGAR